MDSVARQILDLVKLAGLPVEEVRHEHPDGTTEISYNIPGPIQHVIGSRSASGAVNIAVPNGHCLVVTAIDLFNVDSSQSQSIAVNATASIGSVVPTRSVEVTTTGPLLLVFAPATNAQFTFTMTSLGAGNSARAQVTGFYLPQAALDRLSSIATAFFTTA